METVIALTLRLSYVRAVLKKSNKVKEVLAEIRTIFVQENETMQWAARALEVISDEGETIFAHWSSFVKNRESATEDHAPGEGADVIGTSAWSSKVFRYLF